MFDAAWVCVGNFSIPGWFEMGYIPRMTVSVCLPAALQKAERFVPDHRVPRKHRSSGGLVLLACVVSAAIAVISAPAAEAETLQDAITRAFEQNPTLNAQRQGALATRENISRARAGFLPKIEARAEAGYRNVSGREALGSSNSTAGTGGVGFSNFDRETRPRSYGLQLTQPLFDGFRALRATDQAASQDLAAQETLRSIEQTTIFNAVRAYLDVYANRAIVEQNRVYIASLEKQLGQINSRKEFQDVTGAEVAEVEYRVSAGKSQKAVAEAALAASSAVYQQVTGSAPSELSPVPGADKFLAPNQEAALEAALSQNPAIFAAHHTVEAAEFQVKINEAEFLPTVNLTGSVTNSFDSSDPGDEKSDGTVLAQLRMPLYQGGDVLARTRQARYVASQRQLEADAIRDQVTASVITAWGQLNAAKIRLRASEAQVTAAQKALDGIRQAYQLGERTNYDVLNIEQDLLAARINLINAKRDRTLATFAVAQAMGTLDYAALQDAGFAATSADAISVIEEPGEPIAFKPARKAHKRAKVHAMLRMPEKPVHANAKGAPKPCAACGKTAAKGTFRPAFRD